MTNDPSIGDGAQLMDLLQFQQTLAGYHLIDPQNDCEITPGSGDLTIDVSSGYARLGGPEEYIGIQYGVSLPDPDENDPRKVLVYLDDSGTVQTEGGIPAPADPGGEERQQTINPQVPVPGESFCPLAEVYLDGGASDISQGDISSRRMPFSMGQGSGIDSDLWRGDTPSEKDASAFSGSSGSSGQFLSTTGSSAHWTDLPSSTGHTSITGGYTTVMDDSDSQSKSGQNPTPFSLSISDTVYLGDYADETTGTVEANANVDVSPGHEENFSVDYELDVSFTAESVSGGTGYSDSQTNTGTASSYEDSYDQTHTATADASNLFDNDAVDQIEFSATAEYPNIDVADSNSSSLSLEVSAFGEVHTLIMPSHDHSI